MKIVKILRMDIENFKGIRHLTLNLEGKSVSIYGDNATGKTSVYDALNWLLFGKDSHGNAKFDIKPLDNAGNTIAGAMPTVTAQLDINGAAVTLKKQLREKWEKHRGGAERYGGNTVDYYIDDVPTKERQYKMQIETLVASEDVFRVLTNTYRFCRDVSWKDRREVLFDIAGIASDAELLNEPGFDGLREKLGGRNMDDFRAMLTKQRKDVNSKLNLLPARIDECERQMSGLPDRFDSTTRDRINEKIDSLRTQISTLETDENRQRIQNDINAVMLELRKLDMDNEQHRRSQDIPVVDERPALRREIARLEDQAARAQKSRDAALADAQMQEIQLDSFRDRWKQVHKSKYTDGVCNVCGQPLPPEQNAKRREEFEADKKKRLQELVSDSNNIKDRIKADRDRAAVDDGLLSRTRTQLRELYDRLDGMEDPERVTIEDLPGYAKMRAEMDSKQSDLRRELDALDLDTAAVRRELQRQIDDCNRKKMSEDQMEAQARQYCQLVQRVRELTEEQRAKAAYIEHIDELIDQCEAFVQVKVSRVSDAVNSRFSLCRWRLFTEAINGNLQDCCDALVDGVPYDALNSAMQINAGLDVIQTISDYYGIRVPLFVDNAESVTQLNRIDTQVVRLVVSEKDKEMRIE